MPALAAARAAARISSAADMVSIQATSAPPSLRPSICSTKILDRLVLGQGTQWGEDVAGRTDRAGDDDPPPRPVGDGAGVSRRHRIELTDARLEAVQREAPAVRPETVGQDDVRAGVDEGLVEGADLVGMGLVPQLRRVAGGQAHGEQIGAGRAVCEQRAPFGEQGLQHLESGP